MVADVNMLGYLIRMDETGNKYNESKPESRRKVGRLEDVENDLRELKFKM
jgi:hypothetical protein